MTSHLLSRNPTLLYRENATGRTPLEMSRDMYIASRVANPPDLTSGYQRYYPGQHDYSSIINRPASDFLNKDDKSEESKKGTWEICGEFDEKMVGEKGEGAIERKRRIVSLFEANEVAKRVAKMKTTQRLGGSQIVINGGLVDAETKEDVVLTWMNAM
jgi:hypothetical protein